MADLRTTRFYLGLVTGTSVTDLYTVPTGKRAIIKQVTVQEVSGSSCTAQLRLSPLGTIFTWALVAYAAADSRAVGHFWIVVNAGEKIQFARSTSGQLTVTVNGSLHTV